MKLIVFSFALAIAQIAQADMIGYGQKNCKVLEEERGSLKGDDICILKISCEKYALNNPDKVYDNRLVGYCRPLENGRCPKKPENCLDDDSLKAADIPKIKSLPDRPSMKPCGEEDDFSSAPKGTATIVPLDSNGKPVPPPRGNGGRQ